MKPPAAAHPPELAQLPLLPLFDHVLLPGGFVRVVVPTSWRKSAALVQHLLAQQGEVMVAAVPYVGAAGRALPGEEEEALEEEHLDLDRLHGCGTAARVLQLLRRTQSGGWAVTLEGRCRVRVRDVTVSAPQEVLVAAVEQLDYLGSVRGPFKSANSSGGKRAAAAVEESALPTKHQEELMAELLQGTRQLFMLLQGGQEGREAGLRVTKMLQPQGPARVADILGALVARDLKDRLALLSTTDVTRRLELARDLMAKLLAAAQRAAGGGADARALVPAGAGRGRARAGAGLLRPLRLPSDIGGEEGEEEDGKEELRALLRKLQDARPPPEVLRVALREFKRLQRGSDQHPGYAMSLAYLEALAELPWARWSHQLPRPAAPTAGGSTVEAAGAGAGGGGAVAAQDGRAAEAAAGAPGGELSLRQVRARLDAAHYGLDRIKDRIVQYVAVQRLRGWDARAPILCFIGPPGVGKTSLARCVADVLGRPFQRISLGGVRDEAEVRGHRRTYIGAMPGRVIQAVRRAGVRDPVLLLDEVDKMGRDARGDPAAALLEVLDPEQNHAFADTYLGVPFDLSSVVFLSTANRAADIPAPLLDRMEVVHLAGYTLEEKVHIAGRHLVPRALHDHGLLPGQLSFPEPAVRLLAEGYTREAGVRTLARCIAAVCRQVAVRVVEAREAAAQELQPGVGQQQLEREEGLGGGAGELQPFLPPLPPAGPGGALAHVAAGQPRPALGLPASAPLPGGLPAAGLQLAALPAASADSMQLWALLAPLMPGTQQQQQQGRSPGLATALGGYPWAQLAPTPAQQQQQQLPPGGSWFSWLSVLPRGAPGRHLAERHAEAEEAAQRAQQALYSAAGGDAAGEPWDPTHRAAWHSMSLAGSMHSLPPSARCGDLQASPAAEKEPAVPAGTEQAASAAQQAAEPPLEVLAEAAAAVAGAAEVVVDEALIEEVLGPRRFTGHDNSERVASPGTAAGLVWTAVGGQVQYIECLSVGKGKDKSGSLTLTGQLGDVLEESARIALSWVRAHAAALGLPGGPSCPASSWDVHIHLPAGAVPKDGPSAGVTLAVALVSLFTGRCVRADTAMTGELTLRGLVLPVGGMKEKLLAAHTAGMARVIVPARNMRDVQADVPAQVRAALEVLPAERLEDVLRHAFDPPLDLQEDMPRARL